MASSKFNKTHQHSFTQYYPIGWLLIQATQWSCRTEVCAGMYWAAVQSLKLQSACFGKTFGGGATFSSNLLTFGWNLWLTLKPLNDTCDNENKFIPHDDRGQTKPLCLTASYSMVTPAPQGRCPLHHTEQKALRARSITLSVMCCSAAWMNQICHNGWWDYFHKRFAKGHV